MPTLKLPHNLSMILKSYFSHFYSNQIYINFSTYHLKCLFHSNYCLMAQIFLSQNLKIPFSSLLLVLFLLFIPLQLLPLFLHSPTSIQPCLPLPLAHPRVVVHVHGMCINVLSSSCQSVLCI